LRREQQLREYQNQQSLIAKTEEFIRRNLEGQKTKQAKSRRNMLERMDRIQAVVGEKHGGSFGLKKVERTGNNVVTVEDLAIGYGQKVLASGLKLSLHRGEALGIIGANGTGKTTLLRTLLGELREISGKILWGTKTDIGYYSQNLSDLEPRNEVIQELRRVAPLADNGQLRNFLARFLFFGDDVFKLVADLSGGEKGRLALAKLIYSNKNVLILDEPTNHLDIPAREALEDALEEYSGTIITVSHDRFFLDKIASQILSFESDGSTDWFNGNYSEFHEWKEKGRLFVDDRQAAVNSAKIPFETGDPAQPSNLSKNLRDRLEKRLAEIEVEIPVAETQLEHLTLEMSSPEVAADYGKLQNTADKVAEIEKRIQDLYKEWETTNQKLA
jgi:ATP-binding cassette subfamily F protein 3